MNLNIHRVSFVYRHRYDDLDREPSRRRRGGGGVEQPGGRYFLTFSILVTAINVRGECCLRFCFNGDFFAGTVSVKSKVSRVTVGKEKPEASEDVSAASVSGAAAIFSLRPKDLRRSLLRFAPDESERTSRRFYMGSYPVSSINHDQSGT